MTEKEDELNFENFREKDAIVLRAIEVKGGETDTVELVDATGLNHQEIAYRYEKFEERGLAEVRKKADDTTPGLTMNEARLTEKGRQMLDSPHVRRLLGDASDGHRVQQLQMQSEMNELREELEECRRDVSEQERRQEELDKMVDDVPKLREKVSRVEQILRTGDLDDATLFKEVHVGGYLEYECQECSKTVDEIPKSCPSCGLEVRNHSSWSL